MVMWQTGNKPEGTEFLKDHPNAIKEHVIMFLELMDEDYNHWCLTHEKYYNDDISECPEGHWADLNNL